MANEFDPQRIERLLGELTESVLATSQHVEELSSPEFFGQAVAAANQANGADDGGSLADVGTGLDEGNLLDGNPALDLDLGGILDAIPQAEIPGTDLDGTAVGFDAAADFFATLEPETAPPNPALDGIQDFENPIDVAAPLDDGGQDVEFLNPREFGGGDEIPPQILDDAGFAQAEAEGLADFADAGPNFGAEGAVLGAPDPGEAIAANEDAPDFDDQGADEAGFPGNAWGVGPPPGFGKFSEPELEDPVSDRRTPGRTRATEFEGFDDVLTAAEDFRDESREWRRSLLEVLRGVVDDLRIHNAELLDMRRHFEQSRRAL